MKCLQLFPSLSFHSLPLLFLPIGFLLFLLYLASYLWSSEAPWHARCNCAFSSFSKHSCPDLCEGTSAQPHKRGTKQEIEWARHRSLPAAPPPGLTCGWRVRCTSLNKCWGDYRPDWKVHALFAWVATGWAVYSGFWADSQIKVRVRMERLRNHNRFGILPAPMSTLLTPTWMNCWHCVTRAHTDNRKTLPCTDKMQLFSIKGLASKRLFEGLISVAWQAVQRERGSCGSVVQASRISTRY